MASYSRHIPALIERDGQFCHYCGVHLIRNTDQKYHPNGLSVDHIIPYVKGGTDHISNLVLACRRCNLAKKDTDYSWFKLKNEVDLMILFLMGLEQ